jgi:hypothetical protein
MKTDAFIIAIAWSILFLALRYPWLMLLAAAIWEAGIIVTGQVAQPQRAEIARLNRTKR